MSQLNAFDFYAITVKTTRKRELIKAGVPADKIRGTVEWTSYGMKRFPRNHYEA